MKKFKYTLTSANGIIDSIVIEVVDMEVMMALMAEILLSIKNKGLLESDDYRVVSVNVEEVK
jgi:hypothetical protein